MVLKENGSFIENVIKKLYEDSRFPQMTGYKRQERISYMSIVLV